MGTCSACIVFRTFCKRVGVVYKLWAVNFHNKTGVSGNSTVDNHRIIDIFNVINNILSIELFVPRLEAGQPRSELRQCISLNRGDARWKSQ